MKRYNITADPTELHNLAAEPERAALVKGLLARLAAAGATGPPLASAFPADIGMKNSTATELECAQEGQFGYLEPLDWKT
jgi:hypothetical protein